jgi:hypothetical protein
VRWNRLLIDSVQRKLEQFAFLSDYIYDRP